MPDVISPSPTGRAKCRGCGRPLAKSELRFGEGIDNPFGEGETHRWFHLPCASFMRPEKLAAALDAHAGEVEARAWLRATADFSAAHRRLPRLLRAERASSGRARCRSCRETIDKGTFRFVLQTFEEDVRPVPIGFVHASCARAYFGTAEVLERARMLTPELTSEELDALAGALAEQRPSAPA